jgi:hypothetical protein
MIWALVGVAQTEAPASSPIESSADLRNVFQLVSCGETGSGSIPIAVLGKQSNAGMTPPSKLHRLAPIIIPEIGKVNGVSFENYKAARLRTPPPALRSLP